MLSIVCNFVGSCFSFIMTHWKWFLGIHVAYSVCITQYISHIYDTKMMIFKMIPQKMKHKYSPFIVEFKKLKKW